MDSASLGFFRIALGGILVAHVLWLAESGYFKRSYIEPAVLLPFPGFHWLPRLHQHTYPSFLGAMLVAGIGFTLGFCYRLATALLFIAFSYLFLIEQALYLNHKYLLCLVLFLLIWIPANRSASIGFRSARNIKAEEIPAWCLWIFRFQFALVYFYAGVAKINWDWLQGWPLKHYYKKAFEQRAPVPILHHLLQYEQTALFASYAGLFLDLVAAPCLLWKRTRAPFIVLSIFFHAANSYVFEIEIFPWFMLAASLLFFDPKWPRQVPGLRSLFTRRAVAPKTSPLAPPRAEPLRPSTACFLALYAAVQILLPLRCWLYPGYVEWTEEGRRFSWRLVSKYIRVHRADLYVQELDSEPPRKLSLREQLTDNQAGRAALQPPVLLEFARQLRESSGSGSTRVTADILLSLHGRKPQHLIDPKVDLASQSWRFLRHETWLVPLQRE